MKSNNYLKQVILKKKQVICASIQKRIRLISVSNYKGRTIIFLEGVYEKY